MVEGCGAEIHELLDHAREPRDAGALDQDAAGDVAGDDGLDDALAIDHSDPLHIVHTAHLGHHVPAQLRQRLEHQDLAQRQGVRFVRVGALVGHDEDRACCRRGDLGEGLRVHRISATKDDASSMEVEAVVGCAGFEDLLHLLLATLAQHRNDAAANTTICKGKLLQNADALRVPSEHDGVPALDDPAVALSETVEHFLDRIRHYANKHRENQHSSNSCHPCDHCPC